MAGDDGAGSQIGARIGCHSKRLLPIKEQGQGKLARGGDEARVSEVNFALLIHHTQGARDHHVRIAGVSNAWRAGQGLNLWSGGDEAASSQQRHEG